MEDKSLYNLTNPEFDFGFNGKTYRIRRATLDKGIQYQQKVKVLEGDEAGHAKILAYCVYIMIKDQEPTISEEDIIKLLPADIDGLELLTILGFISPSNLAKVKEVKDGIMKKLTTDNSSSL